RRHNVVELEAVETQPEAVVGQVGPLAHGAVAEVLGLAHLHQELADGDGEDGERAGEHGQRRPPAPEPAVPDRLQGGAHRRGTTVLAGTSKDPTTVGSTTSKRRRGHIGWMPSRRWPWKLTEAPSTLSSGTSNR